MVAGPPEFKLRPRFQGTNLALITELGAPAPIAITDYQEFVGTVPSALTAAGDSYDADVGNVVDLALTCKVVAAGTGDLRAQYSSDGGSNWNYLGTGSGPSVSLASTGFVDSGWVSIASAAQSAGAVLIRLASINGTDAETVQVTDAVVRVRDAHTVANIGATGLVNQVEVDLGTIPRRAGHFDITTADLTTGQDVIVEQINGPYTGKGTQADEAEMDQITVSGQAISPTVIRCYWTSPTFVRGNFKFGFTLVSTLNTLPSATDSVEGVALTHLLQISRTEVPLTDHSSLDSTSFGKMHYLSASSAKDLTLPSSPGSVRRVVGLRVSPSSAAPWYVQPYASETIDGAALATYRPGESAILEWGGSDWVTIAEHKNTPRGLFMASDAGGQIGIAHATLTKLFYDTEEVDVEGWFVPGTGGQGSRYTPQLKGYYLVGGSILYGSSVDQRNIRLYVYRNGAGPKAHVWTPTSGAGAVGGAGSAIVWMNGTTDYLEQYTYHDFGSSGATLGSTQFNWFFAYWIGLTATAAG